MSANSKRERIIEANLCLVESLSSIKTAQRTIPNYSDLQNFAITQLPVAAVVGRLPVPVEKHSGRRSAEVLQVRSKLVVDVFVYLQANENADTEISALMDDLWVALYADQSRGALVLSTEIVPEENTQYYAPFAAFKLSVVHYYIHDIGGI
jgi:hypothetical protein